MELQYQGWVFSLMLISMQLISVPEYTHPKEWTWLFYRTFSQAELSQAQEKKVEFLKENVPHYSQLIFSWNALRPRKGYLIFYVQARNAKTKTWGQWHKMVEWGARVQRSFKNKNDDFSRYEYVRLEINNRFMADGFRIKVAVADGAPLESLKSFSISLSNHTAFTSEVDAELWKKFNTVHIQKVPTLSQFLVDHPKADSICSPTSCSMLTSFLKQMFVDPKKFAEGAFDKGLGVYGSWPFNMAHAFEMGDGAFWFFTARLNSFERLYERLKTGIPVVVSVRGPLKGAASAYKHGHLLMVVGFDSERQEVLCHDPAFKSLAETKHRYPIKDFLIAWERSKRLAYLAEFRD
jgi:hypothetical protein